MNCRHVDKDGELNQCQQLVELLSKSLKLVSGTLEKSFPTISLRPNPVKGAESCMRSNSIGKLLTPGFARTHLIVVAADEHPLTQLVL